MNKFKVFNTDTCKWETYKVDCYGNVSKVVKRNIRRNKQKKYNYSRYRTTRPYNRTVVLPYNKPVVEYCEPQVDEEVVWECTDYIVC